MTTPDTAETDAVRVGDPAAAIGPPMAQTSHDARAGSRVGLAARARATLPQLVVLAVPLVLVLVGFWPGHMSADTLYQISQVRSGDLTNQHSPILIAMWQAGWELVNAGPGWVLMGQVVVFLAGVYLILRGALRPLAAAVVTDVIALSPPVFGMLGYLGRDTWYTGLLVLSFGFVVRAIQSDGRRRTLHLVLAGVVAWLTLASRQNAAPAVVVVCVAIAALTLPAIAIRGRRIRPAIAAGLAGMALTVALMGTQVGLSAALGVRDVDPEQQTYIYDLAAISRKERENLFPRDVLPQRGMGVVDRYWHRDTVGLYVFGEKPPIPVPMAHERVASLATAWRGAVVDHPLDYLDARWDLWLRQLAIGTPAAWIYHPQIDPNLFGLEIRFPEANRRAKDYVEAFASPTLSGSAIHAVWAYLLVCAAAALILLRRARTAAFLLAGGLAFSAVTYQVGLFLGAMAVQYRWEFPIVITAAIATVFVVRLGWDALRSRPPHPC